MSKKSRGRASYSQPMGFDPIALSQELFAERTESEQSEDRPYVERPKLDPNKPQKPKTEKEAHIDRARERLLTEKFPAIDGEEFNELTVNAALRYLVLKQTVTKEAARNHNLTLGKFMRALIIGELLQSPDDTVGLGYVDQGLDLAKFALAETST